MSGQNTEIKNPEEMSAEPKRFAFDHSYWSHDGFKERSDGYFEPDSAKYADQVRNERDICLTSIEILENISSYETIQTSQGHIRPECHNSNMLFEKRIRYNYKMNLTHDNL